MHQSAFKYFGREMKPGQVVSPQEDHFHNLSPEKQRAEAAIRAGNRRGRLRTNAVFVFEKRDVAEALSNETDGKHLYELEVDPDDILNRSDLGIYDEIVEALKEGRNVKSLVKEFWSGVERSSLQSN
jgi:hypothetical protein